MIAPVRWCTYVATMAIKKKTPKAPGRSLTDAERYEAKGKIRINGIYLEEDIVEALDAEAERTDSSRTAIIREGLKWRLKL